jgi:ubiquitin-hydrolase Zn-finger-containing protein
VAASAHLPHLRSRRLLRRITNRHATAHHHETSHPIIRSLERGEGWSWCYLDELAFVLDGLRGTTRIPPSPLLN